MPGWSAPTQQRRYWERSRPLGVFLGKRRYRDLPSYSGAPGRCQVCDVKAALPMIGSLCVTDCYCSPARGPGRIPAFLSSSWVAAAMCSHCPECGRSWPYVLATEDHGPVPDIQIEKPAVGRYKFEPHTRPCRRPTRRRYHRSDVLLPAGDNR
jgi:hypothetical protein